MGVIADKVREFFGKTPRPEPTTTERLRQRVSDAHAIMGLVSHSGWPAFERFLTEARDQQVKDLLEMAPDQFVTARGAQVKGFVNGLDAALDAPLLLAAAGEEAERELQKRGDVPKTGPNARRL